MPKPNKQPASTKRKVVTSTIAQVISQILIAGIGVVILKIMTSSLHVQGYGVYSTILAFVSTFSLLTDLGLNAITAREIAKNPEEADDIIGNNMGLRLFMCIVMIPVIFGLSFIFYRHGSHTLHFGILLLSLYLFFDAIRTVAMGYFAAKVRNEITAIVNTAQQVALLLLIILIAALHKGMYGYISGYLVSNVVAAGLTVYYVRKDVRIRPRVHLLAWRRIITLSISLGIIQLINMMYLKADSIILSTIKGTTAVGIYSIAYSLILAFLTLPSFIMTALIPSMATASTTSIKPVLEKALQYMSLFAGLLAVGVFAVRNDIVPIVSGEGFKAAATPLAILGLASAFTYVNSVFGYASVALNKHHKIIYISAANLILNIILNIVLIPHYSVAGAAWATAISEFTALVSTYLLFQRQTGIVLRVITPVVKPMLATVLVFGVIQLLGHHLTRYTHFINLLLESITVCLAYFVALVLLRALPSEAIEILQKLQRSIKTNP